MDDCVFDQSSKPSFHATSPAARKQRSPLPDDAKASVARRLAWCREHMPITMQLLRELPAFEPGTKLACCVHLDVKNAVVLIGLAAAGLQVLCTTCNTATVRDDIVELLRRHGVAVVAAEGMSTDEWRCSLHDALRWGPHYVLEFGAHLVLERTSTGLGRDSLRAAVEATASGVHALNQQLRVLAPGDAVPVWEWDSISLKAGVHNRYMVGLSAMHAFFTKTLLTMHFKKVVIFGFGDVAKGTATAARAYGAACTTIAEVDAARGLEARMAGHEVVLLARGDRTANLPRLAPVLRSADVVITATGGHHVLGVAEAGMLRAGCFVLNVGHENEEVDVSALRASCSVQPALEDVERFVHPASGRHFYLFAAGCMANLAPKGVFGDSLNAFDVPLAVCVASAAWLCSGRWRDAQKPSGCVAQLPRDTWEAVAQLADRVLRGDGGDALGCR